MTSKSETKSSNSISFEESSCEDDIKLRICAHDDKTLDLELIKINDKNTFYIKDRNEFTKLKEL